MIFKTRAKVNLTLEIISRRNDGWHMLDTVFWPLSAGDRIFAERRPSGLAFSCSDKTLEIEGNLAVRAFRLMQERFGFAEGLSLHLEKHVPSQAGLGGGSGDAACVLRICNEVFGLGLSQEQLALLGAPLGADVPALVYSARSLAEFPAHRRRLARRNAKLRERIDHARTTEPHVRAAEATPDYE